MLYPEWARDDSREGMRLRQASVVEIDGSFGEGGGQIVRTASSLAVVTATPCRIFNIRQGRREPGLRLQHLHGLRALAELCGGVFSGDEVGSRELAFSPGHAGVRELRVAIPTAGSITLVLQSLIPAALRFTEPVTVRFEGGGTDTAMSPTLDYLRHVLLWIVSRMGIAPQIEVARRGYYPRGGAEILVRIIPSRLGAINAVERGALRRVSIVSSAAAVLRARRVAERQIEGATEALGALPLAPDSAIDYSPSRSAGSAVCVVAEFENTVVGADGLGARGKRAEEVGREAAQAFLREFESTACLDRHMADQILPYMALADGESAVTVSEITAHCRTNMWVIERFMPGRFEVNGNLIRWRAA